MPLFYASGSVSVLNVTCKQIKLFYISDLKVPDRKTFRRDRCVMRNVVLHAERLGRMRANPEDRIAIVQKINLARFGSLQCDKLSSLFMDGSLDPEEACRLIGEELEIERSCVRPCFDENGSRVCCLVRESEN